MESLAILEKDSVQKPMFLILRSFCRRKNCIATAALVDNFVIEIPSIQYIALRETLNRREAAF